MEKFEQFADQHSTQALEDATVEYLEGFVGNTRLSEIYLPYNILPIYLKGENAFTHNMDFESAIAYHSEFVTKVDVNDPEMKPLINNAYQVLLSCYKKVDNESGFEEVKSKLISLFPDEKAKYENLVFIHSPY